jgi:hypothetical protein
MSGWPLAFGGPIFRPRPETLRDSTTEEPPALPPMDAREALLTELQADTRRLTCCERYYLLEDIRWRKLELLPYGGQQQLLDADVACCEEERRLMSGVPEITVTLSSLRLPPAGYVRCTEPP